MRSSFLLTVLLLGVARGADIAPASPASATGTPPAEAQERIPHTRPRPASSQEATEVLVGATKSFLGRLDEASRAKVLFDFKDGEQRTRWSNLPTGIYQRKGIRMGDLNPAQRAAAMKVLAAALSPRGYRKVVEIVEAEQALKDAGGNPPGLKFGDDEFYLSLLGRPSISAPWMIQFGGHHLAINITVAGTNGVLSPSLTATQPAQFTRNGATVRPLGEENDTAFRLIQSLNESQRAKAILGAQFRDLVLGPGKDGVTIAPEGIRASELTPEQKDLLVELAGKWVEIETETKAAGKMEEIRRNLPDTYFAWSGPVTSGSPAYFRIQGPTVLIEYAPQNLGGSPMNHIHTIYRDPTNEYGKKFNGL